MRLTVPGRFGFLRRLRRAAVVVSPSGVQGSPAGALRRIAVDRQPPASSAVDNLPGTPTATESNI